MGWSFGYGDSKEDVIADRTKTCENEHGIWKTIKYSVRGNVIYSVREVTNKKSGEVSRFIAVDLLGNPDRSGWGYKDLDESCGPYYFDCPVSYFKLAGPPVNETAAEWREAVIAAAAEKKRKRNEAKALRAVIEPGTKVSIHEAVTCRGVKLREGVVAYWKGNSVVVRTCVGLVRLKAAYIESFEANLA